MNQKHHLFITGFRWILVDTFIFWLQIESSAWAAQKYYIQYTYAYRIVEYIQLRAIWVHINMFYTFSEKATIPAS